MDISASSLVVEREVRISVPSVEMAILAKDK